MISFQQKGVYLEFFNNYRSVISILYEFMRLSEVSESLFLVCAPWARSKAIAPYRDRADHPFDGWYGLHLRNKT